MFFGREKELELLKRKFQIPASQLVVIYGRRRVGKSTLIHKFLQKKKQCLIFEGLEDAQSSQQITHFLNQLKKQVQDPYLADLKSWEQIFSYLTEKVFNNKEKQIIFLDEFQWMAVERTKLVSLLKFYWDNHWKNQNVMLILCGSIASFMVNKVIKSKALYGRINQEILLEALSPKQASQILCGKRSKEEVLKYLMIFGGIPKYLEEIDLNQSFQQNINHLCFSKFGSMVDEYDKIFYSQFKEADTYKRIVKAISSKALTLKEIANKLKVQTGGSFQQNIKNLENANLLESFISIDTPPNTKFKKYKLFDEYLIFYFKYIEPNLPSIHRQRSHKLFQELCEKSWQPWLGFAFERFCLKNANYLADLMGFRDQVLIAAPYFHKDDEKFQIDLLYKRSDKVITLCEIKYHDKAINTEVIPEIERKIKLLEIPQGYTIEKALISLYGPNQALQDSQYLHHSISLEDLL